MNFFKTLLLSITLILSTLTHVSAPALAQNPHCTAPNGCSVSDVGAGTGISVDDTNVSEPVVSVLPIQVLTSITDTGLATNAFVCTNGLQKLSTSGCPSGVPWSSLGALGIYQPGTATTYSVPYEPPLFVP